LLTTRSRTINIAEDCNRQQFDTDFAQNWSLEEGMALNLGKATIISFTRNINSINFDYKLC
jgi:hypothetical protein